MDECLSDCLDTPGAADFLADLQLPSVANMANPLDGPRRGSSLGSETHPEFFLYLTLTGSNDTLSQSRSCDMGVSSAAEAVTII